jgi:integrase/recombinase XerD
LLWPVTGQAVDALVKRAARRAGLSKRPSAHWLRHSCASHLLAAGWSIADVRDYLGHANLATTSVYLHSSGSKSADELT